MAIQRHQRYQTKMGLIIEVRRLASDLAWADITVTDQNGVSWTKRQRLREGELPFAAEPLTVSQASP